VSRTSNPEQDHLKRLAAAAAVAEVEDGMVLGLGSGSTAAFAVEALGARVAKGLDVVAIPTSERTAARAPARLRLAGDTGPVCGPRRKADLTHRGR
jgi:ribose 5-phosphate isomerase A